MRLLQTRCVGELTRRLREAQVLTLWEAQNHCLREAQLLTRCLWEAQVLTRNLSWLRDAHLSTRTLARLQASGLRSSMLAAVAFGRCCDTWLHRLAYFVKWAQVLDDELLLRRRRRSRDR